MSGCAVTRLRGYPVPRFPGTGKLGNRATGQPGNQTAQPRNRATSQPGGGRPNV